MQINDTRIENEIQKKHEKPVSVFNCEKILLSEIPHYDEDYFRSKIVQDISKGWFLNSFYAVPDKNSQLKIVAVLSYSNNSHIKIFCCLLKDKKWKSLVSQIPSIHLFEREMAEQWNLILEGHPWPKPVRYHNAYNNSQNSPIKPGVTDFFSIEGEDVHEVSVGPVHAGIIEPGHFRFQCNGEIVMHLEIALGYQHRGIERKLIDGPDLKTIHYIENAAGDSCIANSIAYCQLLESLSKCTVSLKAQAIRGIALELERLANHTGDLGALAMDIGFLPTSAYCGRLRGDFLNMTALICGSRFGRGLVRPGGVAFDLEKERIDELMKRLKNTMSDVESAISLLWDNPTVLARFESTGKVESEIAKDLGLVGVAARACGINRDMRKDFPTGIFQFFHIPVSTWHSGDVFARAYTRWMEIQHSAEFIMELLKALPSGPVMKDLDRLLPDSFAVSLIEGWRGEICHSLQTDKNGKIYHYKIVDPSFHNWFGLAMSMRNQQISDFPICNKSFNLSYCGHDL